MIFAERIQRPAQLPNLLVGRAYERGCLREVLAALMAHRGGLLLISGEIGVGKTALARVLAREATEHGALVVQGHGYQEPAARAYGLWRDLFAH